MAQSRGSSGSVPSQWWNNMTGKLSLSNYLVTQKYSLFDNEKDEMVTGEQAQPSHKSVYGSTAQSGPCCAVASSRETQFCRCTESGNGGGGQCEHCTAQLSYQYRSSLSLTCPEYKPMVGGLYRLTDDKQDPVAVLPVSKSSSTHLSAATRLVCPKTDNKGQHHHQQQKEQLLTNSGQTMCAVQRVEYHHPTSSADKKSVRTHSCPLSSSSSSSSNRKGQTTPSGGEYCLFSAQPILTSSKTSASSEKHQSDQSLHCTRKSQRNSRHRLRIITAVMGALSLSLLVLFLALLKASNDADASNWQAQVTANKSILKTDNGTKGGSISGTPIQEEEDSDKLPAQQVSHRICQTEVCREAGKSLYESINFEANPCDDFFEYSCGRWNKEHAIPEDKSRIGTFQLLDDSLTDRMRGLLEQPQDGQKGAEARSVKFALDLYKECMNRDQIEQLGFEPLKTQLTELLGMPWPILNPDEFVGRDLNHNWMQTFIRIYSLGFAPILTFVVQPDANQTTAKRIYFDSPSFGLGRKEHANQTAYEPTVSAYRKYLHGAASLLAGPGADAGLLRTRLDEIFNFESRLALNSTPPEDRRNAEVWYNRMSLNKFKQLTDSRIDWTEFLGLYINKLNLSYELKDDTLVIVEDIPYYKAMTQLLEETPDYVLYNYMGWMFTNQFAKYMGAQLQELAFEYQKAQQGVQKQLPVWKRCVKQVYSELNWAISRLYVDQHVTPGTKQSAIQLINDLKDAFGKVVLEDGWLDEVTRKRALDKLSGIRDNVAYPEWILNNAELDKFYGFSDKSWVSVRKGRYFDSILDINRFSMIKMYRELLLPVNLTVDWPMPPAMVNAAYAPTQNSITIPVGILRPPFFDPGRPVFLNYGGIGSVIGHEITHGFDDQGQQFDKSGNLVDWWSEETKKRFTQGAKCFIDQYGSIVDKDTNKNLNGINTVGENIADNGGVREAYLAFRAFADKARTQATLPYMTKFSAEQLFFLSYANIWCGSGRAQYQRMMIDYDPHSPLKYRVNVPLSNFDQFAKAWNCAAGTRMNPSSNKCQLW